MTNEEEEEEFLRINKLICDQILANWLKEMDDRWDEVVLDIGDCEDEGY